MAKKTATIPLAGQVLPTRAVTAAEVESGLPTGRYSLSSTQVPVLDPGFGGTAFLDVYEYSGIQLQVLTHWQRAYTRSRYRATTSSAWSTWSQT